MTSPLLRLIVTCAALATFARLSADYPIVSHRYLADPSAMVHDGRVYVYCSNDDDSPITGGYAMHSLVCVSSSDLKNWTDHGEVFRVPANAAWASNSWAPSAVARNGKFYLYFGNGGSNIGVASSLSPIGPFTDAKGSSLVNSSTPGVLPAPNIWIFDPGVFIDDDGQAYMYFGGNGESNIRIIRLNEDMVSTSGPAVGMTAPGFFEAAWVHKRDGVYYFTYSTNPANGLRIDYMTSDSPLGGFTYRGILAGQPPSNNNNNHACTFELRGTWYHVYHNRIVATQAGIPTTYRRNIAVERFDYDSEGRIQQVTYTTDGVPQVGSVDPYARVEAETTNASSGIEMEPCSEGGMNVTQLENGDWIRIRGVDFGGLGAASFEARVASVGGAGTIEVRLDSTTGTLLGSCPVPATGGAQAWTTVSCAVSDATGLKDLYLRFTGTGSNLMGIDWWRFVEIPTPPQITSQPRALTLAPGRRLSLWVEATGTAPLQYRWLKDGVPVADATSRFLEIGAVSNEHPGSYTVEVTNAAGTVVSEAASVAIDGSAWARLVNMSARAPLGSGSILIPGFVMSGGTSQQLLIRAVGPSLARFQVTDVLSDPAMTLYLGATPLHANDNWGDAPNAGTIATTSPTLGAFWLGESSLDAAMLVDLAPGSYTTHIAGVNGTAGVMLFELYQGAVPSSRLVNISARGDIGTGENVMIPGFSITGTGATTLLIRAVGPSLARFGVDGRLANPTLTIFQGENPILTNDDWGQAPDVAALMAASAAVKAFGLTSDSADAAMLVPLMPGSYTAQARGADGGVGNVLVEVYEVP